MRNVVTDSISIDGARNAVGTLVNPCHILFPLQDGTSKWTTSPGQEASNCFPICTWRRAAVPSRRSESRSSCRPATSGRAATGKPTRKNRCRSSVVSQETTKRCYIGISLWAKCKISQNIYRGVKKSRIFRDWKEDTRTRRWTRPRLAETEMYDAQSSSNSLPHRLQGDWSRVAELLREKTSYTLRVIL